LNIIYYDYSAKNARKEWIQKEFRDKMKQIK
jgi:hypothetical protein